jgi:PIN domain
MHVFIPDTNFFIQCRDFVELDWSLVTGQKGIVLAVPRAVQREIDRQKAGGNGRRAARARKASSLFGTVIDSSDGRVTRTKGLLTIHVELLLPKLRAEDFPELTLTDADDQIVAEAIWFARANPTAHVTFISNDTHALLSAKALDLPLKRTPEGWLLPPELDERDKKIAELTRENTTLKNKEPRLEIEVPQLQDNACAFEVVAFPPLDDPDIEALVLSASAQLPMVTDFAGDDNPPPQPNNALASLLAHHNFERWEPPTEKSIRQYTNVDYPGWLNALKERLRSYHSHLNEGIGGCLTLQLRNDGLCPAERLLVEFELMGGPVFAVPERTENRNTRTMEMSFPTPPAPPRGRFRSIVTDLQDHLRGFDGHGLESVRAFNKIPSPSAPNTFRWRDGRPLTQTPQWAFTCEEFRHQHVPETFDLWIQPAPLVPGDYTGSLRCSVRANNASGVTLRTIPVSMIVNGGDTLRHASDAMRAMVFAAGALS